MAEHKKPKIPSPPPSSSSSSSSPSPEPDNHHHQLCRPWPDLPEYLAELILERLPLSDYIRFAAVCTKWRSIQTSHRLRYSPHPPPILPLPWLFPSFSEPNQDSDSPPIATCYSPFEQRLYRLTLHQLPQIFTFSPFTHGWSFLESYPYFLFNPISNVRIQIPPLRVTHCIDFAIPSNCTILARGMQWSVPWFFL